MNKFIGLVVFCLVLFIGYSLLAKTPDGMPPSEETVCDQYSGAAFGLCNAYCEAMDCDSPMPKASATACEKVQANFKKKTGEDLSCGMTCDDLFAECIGLLEECNTECLETDCEGCDITPEETSCPTDEQEEQCKECRNNCLEAGQACVGDCFPPPTRCDDLAPEACSEGCEIVNPFTGEMREGECQISENNPDAGCFCSLLEN